MMGTTTWNRPLAWAFLTALAFAAPSDAGSPRFARLGAFEGSVEVQIDPADSWRPATINLPLPEATRIRTGPAAKLEIELDDTSVFRMSGEGLAELSDYTRLSGGQRITVISLDRGLAYFTGEPGQASAIHLLVPGAQASLKQGSRVRLQASDDSSEVAIMEGAARVIMPSAAMDLHQGQSARVTVPESTHFSLFREITPIESDGWNEELDKAQAQAPASRLDLNRGGKWITAGDYGTVWQPTPDAGWAPYRQGRWIWLQSIGFTWVGSEAWGWKPYHEGRWLQHSDLGWVWVPGSSGGDFSPGDVFWARNANLAVWGPLAPAEQWNGAGPPRQFAAFNVTGGAYVSGAREILPSSAEDLPKDLLKAFLFTAALPSPALPLARLRVTRDPLRTRTFTALEVTPEVQQITRVIVPPPAVDALPVAADVAPVSAPVIAPDPVVPDGPPAPIVPGVIVLKPHDRNGSGGNRRNPSPTTNVAPVSPSAASLNGAGASAPESLYQSWFDHFKGARINYQALGSGAGIKELRQGRIDFAASDMPLVDSQPDGRNDAHNDGRNPVLHFPAAVGAVVAIYNVPGINDGLLLTPEVLAGIYLGVIRYWNDPRIVAVNPRAGLPPTGILLVNRLDGSATTFTWTDYLSKVSPAWKSKVGAHPLVTWPVSSLTANGNDGVTVVVQQTPYSIGYVDYSWAAKNNLRFAALRNRAGQYVFAHPDTIGAAAASANAHSVQDSDLRLSITDAPGEHAYPISAFTYLLVRAKMDDANKRAPMADFLQWMLTAGQKDISSFAYAALPSELVVRERRLIPLIKGQ